MNKWLMKTDQNNYDMVFYIKSQSWLKGVQIKYNTKEGEQQQAQGEKQYVQISQYYTT